MSDSTKEKPPAEKANLEDEVARVQKQMRSGPPSERSQHFWVDTPKTARAF